LAAGIDNPALRRILDEAWSSRGEARQPDDQIGERPAEPRQTG
jgi:hypothetical protein